MSSAVQLVELKHGGRTRALEPRTTAPSAADGEPWCRVTGSRLPPEVDSLEELYGVCCTLQLSSVEYSNSGFGS